MRHIYNRLSDEYDQLYLRHLKAFQDCAIAASNPSQLHDHYVDFYPSFGVKRDEQTEFLVYGQAVDGWNTRLSLDEEITSEKVVRSIKESNTYLPELDHCPLDWVNVQWSDATYKKTCNTDDLRKFYLTARTYRSFFWNVIYKLISDYCDLNRNDWSWARKLVWSNLYKIAPPKANPDERERSWQHPIAFELVKKEIEELKPRYCIVLTNESWWQPFREFLRPKDLRNGPLPSEIKGYEQYRDTKIVVTKRPLYASHDTFVNQVLEVIRGRIRT